MRRALILLAACSTGEMHPFCGDGNLDFGEDCDDGNTDFGDGCSETCTVELPHAITWQLTSVAGAVQDCPPDATVEMHATWLSPDGATELDRVSTARCRDGHASPRIDRTFQRVALVVTQGGRPIAGTRPQPITVNPSHFDVLTDAAFVQLAWVVTAADGSPRGCLALPGDLTLTANDTTLTAPCEDPAMFGPLHAGRYTFALALSGATFSPTDPIEVRAADVVAQLPIFFGQAR